MKVGDDRLRMTNADFVNRAKKVQSELSAAATDAEKDEIIRLSGRHGVSPFTEYLPYIDINSFFTVPVMHALLFGVVPAFVKYILRKSDQSGPHVLANEVKAMIRDRAGDIVVTSDFGRRYKDVIKYVGSYTMEEWTHFTITLSHYILKGALPPALQQLWDLLVVAVAHYCRASTSTGYTSAASDDAAAALRAYAVQLERGGFPAKMFTYNLHILVCQLGRQEKARGAASKDLELVVERFMQVFKTTVGRRVCSEPEKVYSGNYLLSGALERFRRKNPDMRSYEELCGRSPSVQSECIAGWLYATFGIKVEFEQIVAVSSQIPRDLPPSTTRCRPRNKRSCSSGKASCCLPRA